MLTYTNTLTDTESTLLWENLLELWTMHWICTVQVLPEYKSIYRHTSPWYHLCTCSMKIHPSFKSSLDCFWCHMPMLSYCLDQGIVTRKIILYVSSDVFFQLFLINYWLNPWERIQGYSEPVVPSFYVLTMNTFLLVLVCNLSYVSV